MSALNQRGDSEPGPVVVPAAGIDPAQVRRAQEPMPVWVRLTFDDGRPERTQKGFALAWTDQQVQVQVLWEISYYRGARDFWVNADQVTPGARSSRSGSAALHGGPRPLRDLQPG